MFGAQSTVNVSSGQTVTPIHGVTSPMSPSNSSFGETIAENISSLNLPSFAGTISQHEPSSLSGVSSGAIISPSKSIPASLLPISCTSSIQTAALMAASNLDEEIGSIGSTARTSLLSTSSSLPDNSALLSGNTHLAGASPLTATSPVIGSSPIPGQSILPGSSPIPGNSSIPGSGSASLPGASPVPKPMLSLHPGSPRYLQIFMYQHQLLIMQFQQYQFQLQFQYQQLSQQQMSPQQQFLLQNQFHQQMMLLQQQFMQQQAQLHRMAVSGVQFSEHQLNAMYQQQMLTQQSYRQWVISLPAEQQMHLQQRMQASMQQVQLQMAQLLQHYSMTPSVEQPEEQQKKKPSKPRRTSKKKSASSVPDQPELIPPKFPVPELSEQMKQHVQRSNLQQVTSLNQSVKSETKSTTVTTTTSSFSVFTGTPVTKSQVDMMTTSTAESPGNFFKAKVSSPQKMEMGPIDKRKLIQKEILNNNVVLNQYKQIEESFLRQQNEMRARERSSGGDSLEVRTAFSDYGSSPLQTAPESALTPKTLLASKVTADKFPTHPSALLHRIKSEKGLKSPPPPQQAQSIEKLHPRGNLEKIDHQSHGTLPQCESPLFAQQSNVNVMTEEAIRRKDLNEAQLPETVQSSVMQIQSPFSPDKSTDKTMDISSIPSPHSADGKQNLNFSRSISKGNQSAHAQSSFSVSDILGSSGSNSKKLLSSADESPSPELSDLPADMSSYDLGDISLSKKMFEPNLLEAEISDERKNAASAANPAVTMKNKKKELLVEKKRLREIEKQKRNEERERVRALKAQRKAERIHHRIMKQKAVAAAKAALALKKKQKATPSVPTPDVNVLDKIPSPQRAATPTLPPMPKIPLCEPEVHLVYPLVQPAGYNATFSVSMTGQFGCFKFNDLEDPYALKPDPPDLSDVKKDVRIEEVPVTESGDVTVPTNINESVVPAEKDRQKEQSEFKSPDESDETIVRCNNCYNVFSESVFYLDKKLMGVTECNLELEELFLTDQLAFCSNECIDAFQQNLDFDIENDDVELVDAVKSAFMATADDTKIFLPLPQPELRGEFDYGLDKQKMAAMLEKKHPGWKRWSFSNFTGEKVKYEAEQEDIHELMSKYKIQLKPHEGIKDQRMCYLCKCVSDGETSLTSRLLNFNVDAWVHLNCALWSSEVYEAVNGGLHNFDDAYARSKMTKCSICNKLGATINCSHTQGVQQRTGCEKRFHFSCAVQALCGFYKDKTILCPHHKIFGDPNDELSTFSVPRKVYIERDITKQIARMLSLNNDLERKEYTFRVGNLIFHELGQVPTNLLDQFSSRDFIYPIGFETTSIFWDHHTLDGRRYYTCSISERLSSPRFKVKVHPNGTEVSSYMSCSSKGAWEEILRNRQSKRQNDNLLKFFPEFLRGEDLFGLSEPTVQRMLESLPGIDTIPDYNFQHGRTPILIAQLPLALNPSGCIRSEVVRKHHSNRPVARRTAEDHSHGGADRETIATMESILADDWSYMQRTAQLWSTNTKTGQYRRMRQEWRHNVILGRSRIQGLGLFVKRDIEENTFVIEYIGSLIRHEVANRLEQLYERQNRGIYMFRIDNNFVVDATMTGGPARYINHSCFPNCVAEIITIENKKRIIIISNQKICKGEELTYDYKFEFEEDSSKIACLCGASNCRKWMN